MVGLFASPEHKTLSEKIALIPEDRHSQLKLLMLDQLQSLTQHRRMTVVFVTHDLGEAITLSDRIVVLSARPGRIRAIHDVRLERPRDVFKVRFTPAFSEQHERLWDELKDDIIKGTDV